MKTTYILKQKNLPKTTYNMKQMKYIFFETEGVSLR